MVKRGKVPKTTTSLSNKPISRMSKNFAKKGEACFVRQRVTFVIYRALSTLRKLAGFSTVSTVKLSTVYSKINSVQRHRILIVKKVCGPR